MCEALQIQGWNAPAASPQDCLIQHLSEMFAMMGVPDRLRDLGVGSDHIEEIVRLSLTNFNADRQRELSAYEETLGALVLEAW
jgi:alcohol dehydrogenase class IV